MTVLFGDANGFWHGKHRYRNIDYRRTRNLPDFNIAQVISPVLAAQSSTRPTDAPANSHASVRRFRKQKFAPEAFCTNWHL